tara:strand:+ start:5271 stop:5459 length:189 start_codon:yes stop_codon:yes gene_type:complete
MAVETLIIEDRDGKPRITTEDGCMWIDGETITEAMGKAAVYLEAVFDARKRFRAMKTGEGEG